jgi:8-oxo-dGTP pyrophosphatase MutT (NUDIX family)
MRADWVAGEDDLVIAHPKLGQVRHIAWQKPDGSVAYDQIVRAEQGGAICLLVDQLGRIGLIKAWRPVTTNQAEYAQAWPNVDVSQLGRESLEAPRGFPEKSDPTVADTALREAGEEAGAELSAIISYHELAPIVDNTSMSCHFTDVVLAQVDSNLLREIRQDPNEGLIGKAVFYTQGEIDELIATGQLFCGMTLTALALYAAHQRYTERQHAAWSQMDAR